MIEASDLELERVYEAVAFMDRRTSVWKDLAEVVYILGAPCSTRAAEKVRSILETLVARGMILRDVRKESRAIKSGYFAGRGSRQIKVAYYATAENVEALERATRR